MGLEINLAFDAMRSSKKTAGKNEIATEKEFLEL